MLRSALCFSSDRTDTRALMLLSKGVGHDHVGCPSCRLRFTASAAAYQAACPECGQPWQPIASAEGMVGFRLFVPTDVPAEVPVAVVVPIPSQDPDAGRS